MAVIDPAWHDAMLAAVRRRLGPDVGIKIVNVPTLGGSNRTVIFDAVDGAVARRLVSRQTTFVEAGSPFISAQHQFSIMALAASRGIAVPLPVFCFDSQDGLGEGFVCEFAAGETLPRRILQTADFAAARGVLAAQLAASLAQLHAIPADAAPELAQYPTSDDALGGLRAALDFYGEPHPAIEFGLRWLERHRPAASAPQVVLHGDFRLGNVMVGPDGLRALLDWECAHVGDPAEDLGWACTRAWRFGAVQNHFAGLATRGQLIADYRAAGGVAVDEDAVRYWEVFGLARWAVLNVMQAFGHVHQGRRGVVYAACGRNACLIEHDLLMTIAGQYD